MTDQKKFNPQTLKALFAAHKANQLVECVVYSTATMQSLTFRQSDGKKFDLAQIPRCVIQSDSEGNNVHFFLVGPFFYTWTRAVLQKIISKVNSNESGSQLTYTQAESICWSIDRIMTAFETSGMVDAAAIADFKDFSFLINKENWKPDASVFNNSPRTFNKLTW